MTGDAAIGVHVAEALPPRSAGTVSRSAGVTKDAFAAWSMGFLSSAGYAYSLAGLRLGETGYGGGTAWIFEILLGAPSGYSR